MTKVLPCGHRVELHASACRRCAAIALVNRNHNKPAAPVSAAIQEKRKS